MNTVAEAVKAFGGWIYECKVTRAKCLTHSATDFSPHQLEAYATRKLETYATNWKPMRITVRLFAGAAQQAGMRTLTLDLSDGADVAAAREALLVQVPQLKALCDVSLWATATEVLDEHALLKPDSELAMIPPVSGG